MDTQISLFPDYLLPRPSIQVSRSGSFVDNMALPVNRWIRYSAGFSAQWVEELLNKWGITEDKIVLDPFSGSGTVSVVCDSCGIPSIGVEAHPMVYQISKAKLLWDTSIIKFEDFYQRLIFESEILKPDLSDFPDLILRSYNEESLIQLGKYKKSWQLIQDSSPESELTWLALTSILRQTASAGTAQWQYILPNKNKSKKIQPNLALTQQFENMKFDMHYMQSYRSKSKAKIIKYDAKRISDCINDGIDAVITSPPYANNYDYADALRFEMSFWGEVNSWGDLHEKVRKHLIVSSSQHSSLDKLQLHDLLAEPIVEPILKELSEATHQLEEVRNDHGGKKHYHTMVAAYSRDIGMTLKELRKITKPGSHMCWVIGDSAPYGVYCAIDKWIGELALSVGFKSYSFDKLRDRNIKWKNRKHRVPLKEGLLWIEG